MPFFSSLTYTGSRVGGQRERQTQAFESGIAYYPRDYPFTTAYQKYASHLEEQERGKWERTPPAKRASWEKLGTRSPWKPDWEVVLGLKGTTNGDADLVPAQREPPNTRPGARTENKGRPWLLRGSEVSTMVAACFKLPNTSVGLMSEIDRRLMKRHQDLLPSTISMEELWNGALVRVQVKMYNRGSPGSIAAIYCVEDEEASKWLTAATGHSGGEDMEQVQVFIFQDTFALKFADLSSAWTTEALSRLYHRLCHDWRLFIGSG
jgi:ribonuclease P/MRP protein subunit POP1